MSDGQSETCESIDRQNAIDWTKPVAYTMHSGYVCPVLCTFTDNMGKRHAVIERPTGELDVIPTSPQSIIGTFRNVRRKVKNKERYWLHGSRAGVLHVTTIEETALAWRSSGAVVTEHEYEWEVEVDD